MGVGVELRTLRFVVRWYVRPLGLRLETDGKLAIEVAIETLLSLRNIK